MITEKIIFDVREAVRQYTDDSHIDDRYILHLYNIKRAQRLRQDLNNFQRTVDNSVLQSLCLELEETSTFVCGLNVDCDTIMRTVQPIPKPLETHLKSALTSIRPSDRISLPFNFISKEQAIYSLYAPFKGIYVFLDNDLHLYFLSKSDALRLLDCINITGIFEDPFELQNYKNCCGCNDAQPCFDFMTSDYPLQPHHINSIREEIIQDLVRSIQIPEDKNNNASDD